MKKVLLLILPVSIFLSSCHYFSGRLVIGDGNVVTQNRAISGFNGIDVSGAMDVVVSPDTAFNVKVETDQNLQQFVAIYKEGDILKIHTEEGFNLDPTGKMMVYVGAPYFKQIDISGASTVRTTSKINAAETMHLRVTGASKANLDIKAPAVDVELHGASNASLTGETRDLNVDGTGSSNVSAFQLLCENARVDLSGASRAEIFASVKLNARASGASNVFYKGNAEINSHTSGAGGIRKSD